MLTKSENLSEEERQETKCKTNKCDETTLMSSRSESPNNRNNQLESFPTKMKKAQSSMDFRFIFAISFPFYVLIFLSRRHITGKGIRIVTMMRENEQWGGVRERMVSRGKKVKKWNNVLGKSLLRRQHQDKRTLNMGQKKNRQSKKTNKRRRVS